MPSIKLTEVEMRYITLFEGFTGATAMDCVVDDHHNRVIFVVKPGEMGLAMGPGGSNIRKLREVLKKDVEIVEYADNLVDFIKNCFAPAKVLSVRVAKNSSGKKTVYVSVNPHERGLAIGRAGRRISRARILAKRYFGVDNVVLSRQSF